MLPEHRTHHRCMSFAALAPFKAGVARPQGCPRAGSAGPGWVRALPCPHHPEPGSLEVSPTPLLPAPEALPL